MRVVFYLAAIVFLFSCGEQGTSKHQEDPAATVEVSNETPPAEKGAVLPKSLNNIEDIRTAFAVITSQVDHGRIDSTSFKYDCDGETGGTVTYFSDQGQLRMIKHAYYEYSHYSAIDHYFVLDDQPFFVFYDQEYWSFDPEAQEEGETKNDITERRIYIIDDQAVKCLEKNFTTRSSIQDNPDAESIPNQEVACSSLDPLLEQYDLLIQHRGRQEDLKCLVE